MGTVPKNGVSTSGPGSTTAAFQGQRDHTRPRFKTFMVKVQGPSDIITSMKIRQKTQALGASSFRVITATAHIVSASGAALGLS